MNTFKTSISISKELVDILDSMVESGKFRNRSHVIEYLANKGLEKLKEEDKR